MTLGTFPTFYIQITISYADDTSVLLNGKDYAHLVGLLNTELEKSIHLAQG